MEWWRHTGRVVRHIVKISTPDGHGTGFLIERSDERGNFTIATASHVIRDAHTWGQRITIEHSRGATLVLQPADRQIGLHSERDSAFLIAQLSEEFRQALPEAPIPILQPERHLLQGAEVAWCGYPGVEGGSTLCFFAGYISAAKPPNAYLIDGVALRGVSGGPAFGIVVRPGAEPTLTIIGSVTAYRASEHERLGLMLADNVSWAHNLGAAREHDADETADG